MGTSVCVTITHAMWGGNSVGWLWVHQCVNHVMCVTGGLCVHHCGSAMLQGGS